MRRALFLAALLLAGAAHGQTIAPAPGGCTVAGAANQVVTNNGSAGCSASAATFSSTGVATFPAAGALSASSVNITGAPVTSGGSGTTTFPLVYINGGTAPTTFSTAGTLLGLNAPGGFSGNFLDLHLNGGASVLSINTVGSIALGGSVTVGAGNQFAWSGRAILTSPATAVVQAGAVDAASPVGQTLQVQSVVAGTSNTAGANEIIQGSRSTGSGAGGDVDINVSPSTAGATVQNTAASALKVSHLGVVRLGPSAGFTVSTLPASPPTGSQTFVTDAVACTFLATLTGGGSTFCPVIYNGSAWTGG